MTKTPLEAMIETIEDFKKIIAEWILFKDCVGNTKFIEYVEGTHQSLFDCLKHIADAGEKGIDRNQLQYAEDRLDEIDTFRAVVKNAQADNGMSKNDCKVMMLKTFLRECCHWNENKLKHINVHVKDDTEDSDNETLNHIRNAMASINEAMDLMDEANAELGMADILVSDFSFNGLQMDVDLGYGIVNLSNELNIETNGNGDAASLIYKKIRFLEDTI